MFRRISQFCKQLFDGSETEIDTHFDNKASATTLELEVIPRNAHTISRNQISENALKVLYRLHKSGFKAYLVGGGVRDILLGLAPKDFDVVTNAKPEEIKGLFRNSRLVGRRFRLAHIVFGRDVIEVATFRGHHNKSNDKISKSNAEGRLLRDNVYGTIEEDAERRDFTVNALYYDISDFSIRSYGGGIRDIQAGVIKMIGDPETRYREDPVRMIRAARFATKLNMQIAPETAEPIIRLSSLLQDIPAARMFEEVLKLFFSGKALKTFQLMNEHQLFTPLFPQITQLLAEDPQSPLAAMLEQVFKNTDTRIKEGKTVNPAFFYAAVLWYPLQQKARDIALESGLSVYDANIAAMGDVMEQQCQTIGIPRRFSTQSKDIWQLQLRLERNTGTRGFKLLEHPKFRAGYDLLLLRSEFETKEVKKLAAWWKSFVEASEEDRPDIARKAAKSGNRSRNSKPRRRRKPTASKSAKE
ncbi:polynucleotide adenylyltransferase PcnB [Parashewanella spongiae]|uniref:Poly(A) polymerase I n=1 Tax=Parashewanella spongiae TaxID=342950 RepID=A0A3A6UDR2_9GAMM|nr:polynucleotide adenylyltransferase PcnB [Parashewanella spongiae]